MKMQSGGHLVRFILGSLATVVALGLTVAHVLIDWADKEATYPWEVNELVLIFALLAGGLGVMFTDSVIRLLQAILPYKKK